MESQMSTPRDNYYTKLMDLLAVIHRDGGQYTAQHGLQKSWEDAMKKVSDLVVK